VEGAAGSGGSEGGSGGGGWLGWLTGGSGGGGGGDKPPATVRCGTTWLHLLRRIPNVNTTACRLALAGKHAYGITPAIPLLPQLSRLCILGLAACCVFKIVCRRCMCNPFSIVVVRLRTLVPKPVQRTHAMCALITVMVSPTLWV